MREGTYTATYLKKEILAPAVSFLRKILFFTNENGVVRIETQLTYLCAVVCEILASAVSPRV